MSGTTKRQRATRWMVDISLCEARDMGLWAKGRELDHRIMAADLATITGDGLLKLLEAWRANVIAAREFFGS